MSRLLLALCLLAPAVATAQAPRVPCPDSAAWAAQRHVSTWYREAYTAELRTRQTTERAAVAWQVKARRRAWVLSLSLGVPAAAGAVYFFYSVTK